MFKSLTLSGLIALAGLGAGLQQASARSLDDIISSGVIHVGVNPTLPPLAEYNDKNEIVGFEVDYSAEIAKLLGVKLDLVSVGSPDRIPFVTSGKVDMVMGALTRTPDRAKVVDFTLPVNTEALSVLTTEGQSFASWKDMNSDKVTFIEVRGSTPVKFIQDNLPNAKLTLLDSYPDAVRALAQGRGTAMIDVIDYVGQYMNNYPQVKWKVLKDPISVDYDGIGVAKTSAGLKDWLNVAIFQLNNSGETDKLWQKWFGIPMTAPVTPDPNF